MNIILLNNNGVEKKTARPKGGINTEEELVKAIVMNMALENSIGNEEIVMIVSTTGTTAERLIASMNAFGRCSNIATL